MSDDWQYSTEGDLDPDLTEEAGYAGWEPPARRAWTPLLLRASLALVLALFVGSLLIILVR